MSQAIRDWVGIFLGRKRELICLPTISRVVKKLVQYSIAPWDVKHCPKNINKYFKEGIIYPLFV